jgi:hypothetical protein
MNSVRCLMIVLTGALALFWPPVPAQAANPVFCTNYATAAMQSVNAAKANRCGFAGPRWVANFNGHRNWCLFVDESMANAETAARQNELHPCQCEFYANQAMVQIATAVWKKCGFSGPRWIENRAPHQNWCMSVPAGNVIFEAQQRQNMLAACP